MWSSCSSSQRLAVLPCLARMAPTEAGSSTPRRDPAANCPHGSCRDECLRWSVTSRPPPRWCHATQLMLPNACQEVDRHISPVRDWRVMILESLTGREARRVRTNLNPTRDNLLTSAADIAGTIICLTFSLATSSRKPTFLHASYFRPRGSSQPKGPTSWSRTMGRARAQPARGSLPRASLPGARRRGPAGRSRCRGWRSTAKRGRISYSVVGSVVFCRRGCASTTSGHEDAADVASRDHVVRRWGPYRAPIGRPAAGGATLRSGTIDRMGRTHRGPVRQPAEALVTSTVSMRPRQPASARVPQRKYSRSSSSRARPTSAHPVDMTKRAAPT